MSRLMRLGLVVALMLAAAGPALPAAAVQSPDEAQTILDGMSPQEKVGQLFMVDFHGTSLSADSPIATLIRDYHISGVSLQLEQDNFADAPGTAQGVHDLTTGLQTLAYDSSVQPDSPTQVAPGGTTGVYVPLLVAVSDPLDGVPVSKAIAGMSDIPTQMAVGATWDPSLARSVGDVLGKELEAMGINLFLGPSLDVLEEPGIGSPGDLGVQTFGGDPYWVSVMGQAYVEGIQEGAHGRLGVIAEHFPGQGGSDRPLQEEVATVRRSLDQLMQIELPPFFAVTGDQPGSQPGVVDGLLTSHIRYQGFQGNIRATTRPISLDAEALSQLMALDPLKQWRQEGGVTVSDSLGSGAIRRWIDPTEQKFPAHLVARDALLAGNDLLYVSNFRDPTDPDELTTIEATLDFFAQKYQEDKVFAQRVDDAALRILRMKLRIYGGHWSLTQVLPLSTEMASVGSDSDAAFSVARKSATLISPAQSDIAERVGGAPQLGQRIVFFTDVRLFQRCTNCQAEPLMDVRALEKRVLALYGPGAAGQVGNWNIQSFTMADLANYLGDTPTKPPQVPVVSPDTIDEPLRTADWLVFCVLDSSSSVYGADALKILLDARPDIARSKRVVVFSFDVPYGLDATDLSKIDVYYGLYSPVAPFVDVAARLLFQEISAPGASPVSISGTGYDLITALKPDPSQIIGLTIKGEVGDNTPTPPPTGFTQGNLVTLETGVILDSNGHPVPDNTPVEFVLSYQGENLAQTIEAETENGVARTTFRLDRLGLLTIQAHSDPATRSNVLQLNVQEGVPAFPTVIAPTPFPTDTPAPTPTPGPATPTASAISSGGAGSSGSAAPRTDVNDLLMGLLGVLMIGAAGYFVGGWALASEDRRVRSALLGAVGGLVGYNYLALGLPGTGAILNGLGMIGGWAMAAVGGVATLGGALVWMRVRIDDAPEALAERGEDRHDQQ